MIARLVLRVGAIAAALRFGGDTVGAVLLLLLVAGAIATDAAERRELRRWQRLAWELVRRAER